MRLSLMRRPKQIVFLCESIIAEHAPTAVKKLYENAGPHFLVQVNTGAVDSVGLSYLNGRQKAIAIAHDYIGGA